MNEHFTVIKVTILKSLKKNPLQFCLLGPSLLNWPASLIQFTSFLDILGSRFTRGPWNHLLLYRTFASVNKICKLYSIITIQEQIVAYIKY